MWRVGHREKRRRPRIGNRSAEENESIGLPNAKRSDRSRSGKDLGNIGSSRRLEPNQKVLWGFPVDERIHRLNGGCEKKRAHPVLV